MSINNFNYSKSGLAFTEEFEGLRLAAYQDQVGVWTIGYGHTANVYPGMQITQLQAEQFLLNDVQLAVHCVNGLVQVLLTQDEFDALVDFVFNLGTGAFSGSTLLRMINAQNFAGAAGEFVKWDHAKGQVVAGLLARRQAEVTMFESAPVTDPAAVPGPVAKI